MATDVATTDSCFTNAEILNHIDSNQRLYVGDLKFNRTITVDGKDWKASEWVKTQLEPLCRRKTTIAGKEQWYFTKSIRIPGIRHVIRIVELWKQQRDAEPRKMLITNRTYWEVHRILKTYRKRWTGAETFHRDGKQQVGLGACQLRSGESQIRHRYLVFLAYSALMTQLRHDLAQ
ncbi:transposase [Kouleothrix sp.]|uniref:transposase n=1 Tax=Kouleothrix sp. TaxID=2779161 RepID=UPI0039194AFE